MPMRDDRDALNELNRLLAADAVNLCMKLLPLGVRDGKEWRVGSLAGEKGASLAVHLGGGHYSGFWKDFAGGSPDSGTLISLIAHVKFGGDMGDAIKWAKSWLGLDGADPERLRQTRRQAEAAAPPADPDAELLAKRKSAKAMYLGGIGIEGTPGEWYLAGRGLPVRRLGFPLRALRFRPALWDVHTRRHWPAMVAAIVAMDGTFLGCHRTFLEVLSDGKVRKAPIVGPTGKPAAKRCLGDYRGGVIRLWRGTLTDPETGEVRQAPRLRELKHPDAVNLTEGIEDGVTVALGMSEVRVDVGISVSNMANLAYPALITEVVLWRQNDRPGSAAAIAFDKVAARHQAQGKRVLVVTPPKHVKDINEVVQSAA